jgi:hypothetical protein
MRLVVKSIAAVEKFAGKISPQMTSTGIISGIKADLKSLILSCFLVSIRARNIIRVNLARSDVWNER